MSSNVDLALNHFDHPWSTSYSFNSISWVNSPWSFPWWAMDLWFLYKLHHQLESIWWCLMFHNQFQAEDSFNNCYICHSCQFGNCTWNIWFCSITGNRLLIAFHHSYYLDISLLCRIFRIVFGANKGNFVQMESIQLFLRFHQNFWKFLLFEC